MMKPIKYCYFAVLTFIALGFSTADAQQTLAQDADAILKQNCLICHEPLIESAESLIDSGVVVREKPDESELYTRLLEDDPAKRMPFNAAPLSEAAIRTIHDWIQAGAPSWESQHDVNFITPDTMLTAIQRHLETLDSFDRPFARYFTITHLYNAGESPKTLGDYRAALSKLVNSLSWVRDITNPQPIDEQETIFYIDLGDYDWDRLDVWTQLENIYPYGIEYDAELKAGLHAKLTHLREEMACEVPFVHVDWFLATASLPPLYHDILDLPTTDRELERKLGINVAQNLQRYPGRKVWRAGFNDSEVSQHNRVVERHTSPYGAYWKSYDFAGSAEIQNVFINPLSFRHDGGEIVFNLPNGLQAYYITDADGNRIDAAPIEIVSNPVARDPTVRTGLSCIGCHTKGMQRFEDEVRADAENKVDPPFNKEQVLRLYVPQAVMDEHLDNDTQHFKVALEATGNAFDVDGAEPVQFLSERFQDDPLDAAHAAAALGLETEALLAEIEENPSLQNLGLTNLLGEDGMQRDAWTSSFEAVVSCLYGDDCVVPETPVSTLTLTPFSDLIPDVNLHAVIAEALGKAPDDAITKVDLANLTQLEADGASITDLTGLAYATKLERIVLRHNAISDLSPLADLISLHDIHLAGNRITDVSSLARLINVRQLGLEENTITDLSPLKALVSLNWIGIDGNPVSDVSPLAGIFPLRDLTATRTAISDFSPLAKLPRLQRITFGDDRSIKTLPSLQGLKALRRLEIRGSGISDISGLAGLAQLTSLVLNDNSIADVSPLAGLTGLTNLHLESNLISDVSPLAKLADLKFLNLRNNSISDVSSLTGLTRLEHLNLYNNAISDFSPLEKLSEKTSIVSADNPGFPIEGPKLTGPWLWVMVPGEGFYESRDLLARASGGKVTTSKVATDGVTAGAPVGSRVWTAHKIDPGHGNNINKMLDALGAETVGERTDQVVYGSIVLNVKREQRTTMLAGGNAGYKVWLNGALVRENDHGEYHGYEEFFPITLKQGKNVLLVAIRNANWAWSGFFGFTPDAEYTVLAPDSGFSISTDTTRIEVGATFTVHLKAANVTDLAGWRTDITFDPTVLKANKVSEGDFLKQAGGSTHFQEGTIQNTRGRITGLRAVRTSRGRGSGQGTLLSIQFTALASGGTRVTLRNFRAGSSTGKPIVSPPIEMYIVVEGQPAAPTLVPEDTALFHNYPNPFNPETWIPYQLEQPADVKIAIYAANGQLVRMLNLGHQAAGYYIGRRRAAHWDGKNTVGEPVASGVYFYQLQADNLSFLRKMVILK